MQPRKTRGDFRGYENPDRLNAFFSRQRSAHAGLHTGGDASEWRSSVKAYEEFDEAGRMRPSAYYGCVVDVMEELVKFMHLTRDTSQYLTDRYSERKEAVAKLEARVELQAI